MYGTVIAIDSVVKEFKDHIRKCGGGYTNWYVGVASNPRDRLFSDHNVDEKHDAWIFRNCGTDTASRRVEQCFLNLGCQGGPGGGDHNSTYTYAYQTNNHTRE